MLIWKLYLVQHLMLSQDNSALIKSSNDTFLVRYNVFISEITSVFTSNYFIQLSKPIKNICQLEYQDTYQVNI